MIRAAQAGALLLVATAVASAQAPTVRIIVSDSLGARIPFAVVTAKDGVSRAANDFGVVTIERPGADSLRILVRRMGFQSYEGWIAAEVTEHPVTLVRVAQRIAEVRVAMAEDNVLFRRGFYERLEEQVKLATTSRFFTPEDLDRRNAATVTELLAGVTFITLRYMPEVTGPTRMIPKRVAVVTGRGRCPATILLDGQAIKGTYEDYTAEGVRPTAMISTPIAIDDVVSGGAIAGVEVYAVASSAPLLLRNKATRLTCPLVALWTGRRQ